MKARELRDLTLEELRQKEAELEDEIFRLKIKRHTQQLENKMVIRSKKRILARMKTIIRIMDKEAESNLDEGKE